MKPFCDHHCFYVNMAFTEIPKNIKMYLVLIFKRCLQVMNCIHVAQLKIENYVLARATAPSLPTGRASMIFAYNKMAVFI